MATPTIDWSKYEDNAKGNIDFSKYESHAQAPPIGEIRPQESGAGHYLQGVISDIRTGGTTTLPGRMLHSLGARGTNSGVSEPTGEFIGGPVIGPAVAAHGISQLPEHPISGINETLRGVGQTLAPIIGSTIPGAIPAAVMYGGIAKGVQSGVGALGADPDTSELAGNVAAMASPSVGPAAGRFLERNASPIGKAAGTGVGLYEAARHQNPLWLAAAHNRITEPITSGVATAGRALQGMNFDLGVPGTEPAEVVNGRPARPGATGPNAARIDADPKLDRLVRKSERPNGPIHGSGARMASPAAEPDVDLTTRRPPAATETPRIASPEASTPKRAIDMSETELSQQYKRQGIQSKSFEQADELARGRAENKAVMEHPGEESIPSQHSQPKIASPVQPSLTRDASGAPEAVWPKEYKQPTNGGGGNYTADDLSKLKQKHGIASPDEDLTPQLQASLDKVKTKAKIESIGDQVESSLGGKKLAPDVPLRNQIASPAPNGHTAVESSALKSYKYDPNAKEFHAQFKSGDDVHVYGDVSPEEAKAFEGEPSKGKAIQSIKRNPLVAKIVNGKRVSVKPTARIASPND